MWFGPIPLAWKEGDNNLQLSHLSPRDSGLETLSMIRCAHYAI